MRVFRKHLKSPSTVFSSIQCTLKGRCATPALPPMPCGVRQDMGARKKRMSLRAERAGRAHCEICEAIHPSKTQLMEHFASHVLILAQPSGSPCECFA